MCFIAERISQSFGRRFWPLPQSAVSILVTLCTASAMLSLAAEPRLMIKNRASRSVYIVLLCVAASMLGQTLGFSSGILRIDAAQAQSGEPNPAERARTAV